MACLAARPTASLPGMPQCPGTQIKTTLRWEGVRTKFKRMYTLDEGVRGVNVLLCLIASMFQKVAYLKDIYIIFS